MKEDPDREFINALRGTLRLEPLYPPPREHDPDATLFTRPDRPAREMHWARDPWTMLDARDPR